MAKAQTLVAATVAPATKRAPRASKTPAVATLPVAPVDATPAVVAPVAPVVETPAVAPRVQQFVIASGRPGSGSALYAHTRAFLELHGMLDGKTVSATLAKQTLGDSAVANHTKQFRFKTAGGQFQLTDIGLSHFSDANRADRQFDDKTKDLYIAALTTGAVDGLPGTVKTYKVAK